MTKTQQLRKDKSDIIKMQNSASKGGGKISTAEAWNRVLKARSN